MHKIEKKARNFNLSAVKAMAMVTIGGVKGIRTIDTVLSLLIRGFSSARSRAT